MYSKIMALMEMIEIFYVPVALVVQSFSQHSDYTCDEILLIPYAKK